jgi:hypothetical protein
MFGEGITQGRPVSANVIGRRHPRAATTVRSQSSGCETLPAPRHPCHDEARDLADRQAVTDGDGAEPHERRAAVFHRTALDRHATERVRPVEHDDRHLRARRGAQRERHRPDVRVVAAPDVLQIDDEHVDPFQLRRRRRQRLERLAVEARHRNPGARVAAVGDADHVLRLAAHAVLGPEQARRPHPRGDQTVDDVDQVARDARRMAEHAHAPTPQQVQTIADENVETGCDRHTGIIRR